MKNLKSYIATYIAALFTIGILFAAPAQAKIALYKSDDGKHQMFSAGDIHFGAFIIGISATPEMINDAPAGIQAPTPFTLQAKGEIDFGWKSKFDSFETGALLEIRPDPDKTIVPDKFNAYLKHKTFGTLYLGVAKNPASKRYVKAPDFYFGDLNAIEGQDFKPLNKVPYNYMAADDNATSESRTATLFDVKDETDLDYDEAYNKIIYYTPRLFGFELGVSYTPSLDARSRYNNSKGLTEISDDDDLTSAVAFGANYRDTLAGYGIAASFGYLIGMGGNDREDASGFSIGAAFVIPLGALGKVEVGGGYLASTNFKAEGTDENVIIVGAAHKIKQFTYGVNYGLSEQKLDGGNNRKENQLEFGGSYAFNKHFGISTGIELISYEDSSEDSGGERTIEGEGIVYNLVLSVDF